MKNIWVIIKKELKRFFTDYRMISSIVLPGLLIFLLYSVMGTFIKGQSSTDNKSYSVAVTNAPESYEMLITGSKVLEERYNITIDQVEAKKQDIMDKKLDLLLVFPENFDELVASYVPGTDTKAPNIEMYYNGASKDSASIHSLVASLLDAYESGMNNKFDINNGTTDGNLASDKEQSGMILSMMLPMLLTIFLFTGCMSFAPESIAGEKERGTIATLLVTPLKRSHLAIGKIVSLSAVSTLSAISSFIGTILSLPKMMGGGSIIDLSIYSISDYVLLFFIIISMVLFIISLLSVISAYARSVKEATTLVMPFMIIATVLGVFTMTQTGVPAFGFAFIPFYNTISSMSAIFSFQSSVTYIVISLLVNLACSLGLVFLLTRMFNNEKILFNK